MSVLSVAFIRAAISFKVQNKMNRQQKEVLG